MRIAFFSPMPPSRSGIADYSAALLDHLREHGSVDVFEGPLPDSFDPGDYDSLLYQIGNNPSHEGAYRAALEHPGVVVLHEANLHHLIAEITIRRGDWDTYMEYVEADGGPAALEYARRVRKLEVGPDYDGVPMLCPLLQRALAVIVHSRFVEEAVRTSGFSRPIAVIPHGAWLPAADGMSYRNRLGLDETAPLAGIFGFLKPYKRIPESLRAFRRLLRIAPAAGMILVGEPHPGLDIASLLRSLDLTSAVRTLGYVSTEDLTGYLGACDIVLNLRSPTVGETSGTLLRSLGLGKAVLVSDAGAFRELPDDVCLKVPPGPGEEDLIFEYLNLLVSRRDVRLTLGSRARRWVEENCSWPIVARQYAGFLEAVAGDKAWPTPSANSKRTAAPVPQENPISAEALLAWSPPGSEGRDYVEIHLTRFVKTLSITPPGGPDDRILEMGAYMQMTPLLDFGLGYGHVRGCYFGPAGRVERKEVTCIDGRTFDAEIDLFDAERDTFPYPDGHFTTVLCCELIEHLTSEPMHMMAEINRILKPGGHLVLTTPNIGSMRAILAILTGYHPGFFPAYIRPRRPGETADARHSREYTPKEIARLLIDSGFDVSRIETGPYREVPRPEQAWVRTLMDRYELSTDLREDCIYALGTKVGPVRVRYPDWLYD